MENAIEIVHVTKKFKETVAVNGLPSVWRGEKSTASSGGMGPARRCSLNASAVCFR